MSWYLQHEAIVLTADTHVGSDTNMSRENCVVTCWGGDEVTIKCQNARETHG